MNKKLNTLKLQAFPEEITEDGQKYNIKLKLVADSAGIDKAPSSHDGRRSCGYMLLNAGVPISVVSCILDHSSIRQMKQAYARLLDETISEEIKKRNL